MLGRLLIEPFDQLRPCFPSIIFLLKDVIHGNADTLQRYIFIRMANVRIFFIFFRFHFLTTKKTIAHITSFCWGLPNGRALAAKAGSGQDLIAHPKHFWRKLHGKRRSPAFVRLQALLGGAILAHTQTIDIDNIERLFLLAGWAGIVPLDAS